MAVVGTATLNIVPKIQGGLANAINGELSKANISSMGKGAGSSFMGGFASGASIGIWSSVASRAIGAVTSSLGSAASRVDTLSNYPKIMESLGVAGTVAKASMDKMSTSLDNVPTRLDDMANTVQGIYAATMKYGTGLDTVTDAGLALNSMLLAGGQSTAVVNSAMEQFRQMVAKGKPDMQDWRALVSAAPGQMDQLAKAMLGPTAAAEDLYAALGGGREADYTGEFEWGSISMGEFVERFAGMREQFEGAAEGAQSGISTSFANMRNAVTKGVANVLGAFGQERIASAIGDVKGLINDVFGRSDTEGLRYFATEVAPMVSGAWDHIISTVKGVGQDAGPSVRNAVDAVIGSAAEVAPTMADFVSTAGSAVGDAIKGVADIVTDAAPIVTSVAQGVLPVVGNIISAVGPALPMILTARTALGGFGSVAGVLAKAGTGITGFATSFGKLGKLASSIGGVLPMIKSVSDIGPALSLAAESSGGFLATLNPMGIAAGAAAVGVGILGVGLYDAWRQEREFNETYDTARSVFSDMRTNTEGLGAALLVGSDGMRDFGTSSSLAAGGVGDLLTSLQEHNRRNSETRQSAEESIFMLDQYKEIIDECAGAGEVSAEKQGKLKWALDGLKEATGETFTEEQVLTGEFKNQAGEAMNTKEAIDQLIESKKQEARVNALQDMYTDAIKEQVKAQQELETAQENYNEKFDTFMRANKDAINPMTNLKYTQEELVRSFNNWEDGKKASQNLEVAKKACEGLNEEVKTYENLLGEAAEAENAHWGKREGIIMTTEKMRDACERLGIDAAALSQGLQDAGVSVESFANVGGDQFALMAEMAGGDMATLIGLIQDYNATEFDSKYGSLSVDGYGNVRDAVGTIYEWNGTEFVPKYASIETNAGEATGEVEAFSQAAQSIPDATANVGANVNGTDKVEGMTTSINRVPLSTNAWVTAHVSGKGTVESLSSVLTNINGKTAHTYVYNHEVTVKETKTFSGGGGGHHVATGGHIEPRHASGYIAAGPTHTNFGLVGENGIEAVYNNDNGSSDVYPLNNPRYLGYADPLAGRIADAIAQKGMGGAIDYDKLAAAVASAIAGMAVNIDSRALIGEITAQAARASRMYAG